MNIQKIKIWSLIFFFLAATSTAFSQENTSGKGIISGQLIDSIGGNPLEFATVALLKKGSNDPIDGRVTDTEGKFQFKNLPDGNYFIKAGFLGYASKTIGNLNISDINPERSIGKILLITDASLLDEVKIQTMRPTIIQKADRLVVNIEGSALAAGNSAFHVLSNAPGVYIDPDGNIQLNGKSGVTVMLNDKLTYLSAQDLRTMLEGMSAENIKDIEIITNPSAKYDAEGSSGILNINLKKNLEGGMNGSVYAGYNYNGIQHGYTTGGRINHKTGNWDSFVTVDLARRVGGREATFTRIFYGDEVTTYFDQVATGNFASVGPSAKAGTDYNINDNHSIGVTANFTTNNLETDFLTDTYIGFAPNDPELYIDANNYFRNTFTNYTANIHYLGKLDTLDSSIAADFDFVKITHRGESDFFNYFQDLTSNGPVTQDFLYTNTPNGFDIYSAKVDYTKGFKNSAKFEMGVKMSRVLSDNDSQFYFNNDGLELDLNRTNHFIYDEDILAAYVNLNHRLSDKFTLQAGLRAENTNSRGESLTTGEVNKREYLSLFPSVFLQQDVTENYQISYSYSRRIQRPNYSSLNPFISYRDPYTYVQGNPYLRPQYTNAFGISQLLLKRYSLALNYQLLKDVISELPILVEETATTIYTTGNVDDSQNFSLTAIAPVKVMKNWDTNNTLILSYNEFNTVEDGLQLVNEQFFYMLQSNHNILLPRKFKMELNAVYRGPAASGLYRIAPMGWLNAGLKRSFSRDKLEASVNVNDIFKTQRLMFTTDIGGNVNEFDQYFRNRNVVFTLRYKFSQGEKFDSRQRSSGPEEVNRT